MARQVQEPGAAIGARVCGFRKGRGWSQARLVRRLAEVGLSLGQSNLARLENGKRDVSVADLFALALALDVPPLLLLGSDDDRDRVRVGTRGESPGRLRAWATGRQPLDTVRGQAAYREHTGRLREAGSGMTLGPFLRDLADQLDADSAAGQEETITAATDYLRGALAGVRYAAQRAQEG